MDRRSFTPMFQFEQLLRPGATPTLTPEGVYNFLSVSPADGQANYVTHYQQDALEFDYFTPPADPATVHESERLHQEILSHLPASARTVLDVGCGSAWVARELLPHKAAVVSCDIALRNTTEALRRYPAPHHFAVTGDAFDLPFRDGSLDAVISSEVMEHVPDVSSYLRSLVRVVRPGGRVILSTPYDETIQYSLCIHCNRPTPLHAHLHSFNERLMEELLAPLPVRYTLHTLSNKALLYLRTHGVLRHLPFRAWRRVDGWANRVVRKPGRLVVVLEVG